MRVGLSEPPCRGRLQTALKLPWLRVKVVNVQGKVTACTVAGKRQGKRVNPIIITLWGKLARADASLPLLAPSGVVPTPQTVPRSESATRSEVFSSKGSAWDRSLSACQGGSSSNRMGVGPSIVIFSVSPF